MAERANEMAVKMLEEASESLIDEDTDRALLSYMAKECRDLGIPYS